MTGLRELRLEVRDFTDVTRWRWVLTDSGSGAVLASHDVRLDVSSWQFEAHRNLTGYLSWHVAPDRHGVDDARIVADVGEWIAARVFGPVAGALLATGPATVRVIAPPPAQELLLRPLELAHVEGKPLSASGITLIMQLSPGGTTPCSPRGVGLRVLGLFSLPDSGKPLSLRRERQALLDCVAATGKAVEVRVLQYGVTRSRLREILDEPSGWDIVHVSGHGAPGALILETPAGQPDPVTAADLADLLAPARARLVTFSACWSAATADQRRLLGLPVSQDLPREERVLPTHPPSPGALAAVIADRLDCAVLAMRYPVEDDFAISLSVTLYDRLIGSAEPLPQAVAATLRQLSDAGAPALSVATPALFGARAADLTLVTPDRGDVGVAGHPKMHGFGRSPQPDRFVGRTAVMTRASSALAAESGIPAVLLHGMPGCGKTACALELSYTHEHAFDRLIFYKAPDEGMAVEGALTDLAFTLEQAIPGLQMAHLVFDEEHLTPFLPMLTELMERSRLLLIIDSAESLLSEDGTWHDSRWTLLIGALNAHEGPGRLILTSRRIPADLAGLRVEPVDALSADEALLLVRELPNLQALIDGKVKIPGLQPHEARRLAKRALETAHGHPKLLELANGQASAPERLAALVKDGDHAWRRVGGLPANFFSDDPATASGGDYLQILTTWTQAVVDTLAPSEQDLFWLLSCLEARDWDRQVLDNVWPLLRQELNHTGQPDDLSQAVAAVAAAGLAAIRPEAENRPEAYTLHPQVAATGRDRARAPFRKAVDEVTASFWYGVYGLTSGEGGDGDVDTELSVQAGLSAIPYLARQQQWADVSALVARVIDRNATLANAAALLPAIQQATRHDPSQADTMALVLQVLDPNAAEAVMREYLDASVASGDYRAASIVAGRLMYLCRQSGRPAEALDFADQQITYTTQADLGPWTQLADQAQRLQVLNDMGQASDVRTESARLRDHMATLPPVPGLNDPVAPWSVREGLLDAGSEAARQLEKWAEALALNAAMITSQRGRNATPIELAQTRYRDYFPLLRLGRVDQALAMLQDCLEVFQDARHVTMIGSTLFALADVEDERGHGDAAIGFQRDALRYAYSDDNVTGITIGYHNLGNYLARHASQPAQALASHLAAAVVSALGDRAAVQASVNAAAADLCEFGADAALPTSVTMLDGQLGPIPGTNLAGLIAKLSPDSETAEELLLVIITQVQALATALTSGES